MTRSHEGAKGRAVRRAPTTDRDVANYLAGTLPGLPFPKRGDGPLSKEEHETFTRALWDVRVDAHAFPVAEQANLVRLWDGYVTIGELVGALRWSKNDRKKASAVGGGKINRAFRQGVRNLNAGLRYLAPFESAPSKMTVLLLWWGDAVGMLSPTLVRADVPPAAFIAKAVRALAKAIR